MASEFTNLKRAVERLVSAELNYSWKGGLGTEADRIEVQQELNNARTNYRAKLEAVAKELGGPGV